MLVVPAGAAAGRRVNDGRPAITAIVLGLCGAIDPALRVGETVVYGRIVDGADDIRLDDALAQACGAVFGRTPVVAANVSAVVGDPSAKAAVRLATGAAVIDMEGAGIARALHLRGIRVAMVRVVSDDALSALPDLRNAFSDGGALRPAALAVAFARSPLRSARFVSNALRALRELQATAAQLALNAPG